MESKIKAAERELEKLEQPKEWKSKKDSKRARLVLSSESDDSDDHRVSSRKSPKQNATNSSTGKNRTPLDVRRKRNWDTSEAESSVKRSKADFSKANGNVVPQRRPVVPAYRLNDTTIKGVVLSSPGKANTTAHEELRSKRHLDRRMDIKSEAKSGRPAPKDEAGKRREKIRNDMQEVREKYIEKEKDNGAGDNAPLTDVESTPPLSERERVLENLSKDSLAQRTKSKDAAAGIENKVKEGKSAPDRRIACHEKAEKLSSCEVKEEDVGLSKAKVKESISSVKKKNEMKPLNSKKEKPRTGEGSKGKLKILEEKRDKARSSELKTGKFRFSKEKVLKNKLPIPEVENTSSHTEQDEKLQKRKSLDAKVLKGRNLETMDWKLKSNGVKKQQSKSHGAREVQLKSKRAGLSSPRGAQKYDDKDGSGEEAPYHSKVKSGGPCSSSRADKQKLREQIKAALLNSGWTIDLRPRRGRDYEDQVYMSPQGTGYWSITKAFAAFQEQAQGDDGRSAKVICVEALDILKRNVVKKRRDMKEHDEIPNNGLDGRRKRKKVKDLGGRKKMKGSRGSSTKGAVASSSEKFPIQNIDRKQRGCTLLVRGANQEADAGFDEHVPYIWKRTVLSWMIDLGIVPANGKVKYMSKKKSRALLEGRITRDGIHCGCCSKVLTVSRFEVHAGSKLNQPYENIIVEETGMSLLESQLQAWEKHEEPEKRGFCAVEKIGDDPDDDTCGICGDGGDLICCDSCPSTFHFNCLGIQELPLDDWHCMYCSCKYCRSATRNALGDESAEVAPLLSCLQCEEKYHVDCIPEGESIPVSSNRSRSFCGRSCRKVFNGLEKLIGIKNDLDSGFTWTIIHSFREDSPLMNCSLPQKALCNSKIAVAFSVMDECFLPSIDQRSGINLIHNVIYSCGSNFKRLNYRGFYTFILERGEEIICVASVRIHGTKVAEMPYIGTRNMYRRQGMCRRLLNGIEEALRSLRVKKLIIPAISELADAWITAFGFKPIEMLQKRELLSTSILVFPSAGLLQKILFKGKKIMERSRGSDEGKKSSVGTGPLDKSNVADGSSAASVIAGKSNGCAETTTLTEDDVEGTALSSPCLNVPTELQHNSYAPKLSRDQATLETDSPTDPSEENSKKNAQLPVHALESDTEIKNDDISMSEDDISSLKKSTLCASDVCSAGPHGNDQFVTTEPTITTSNLSFGNGTSCVTKVLDGTDSSLGSLVMPGTMDLLDNDPVHMMPKKKETSSPENKTLLKDTDSEGLSSETNRPSNDEVMVLDTSEVKDIVAPTEDEPCHKDDNASNISEPVNIPTENDGLSDDSPCVLKGIPTVEDVKLLHQPPEGTLESSEIKFDSCSFRTHHQSSELIGALSIGSNSDILSPTTVGTCHPPHEPCEMFQGTISGSPCVPENGSVVCASGFSCVSKHLQIENAYSEHVNCKALMTSDNGDFDDASDVRTSSDSILVKDKSEQMPHETCADAAKSKACPLDAQVVTQVTVHHIAMTADDSIVENHIVATETSEQKSEVFEQIPSLNGLEEGSCPASKNEAAE